MRLRARSLCEVRPEMTPMRRWPRRQQVLGRQACGGFVVKANGRQPSVARPGEQAGLVPGVQRLPQAWRVVGTHQHQRVHAALLQHPHHFEFDRRVVLVAGHQQLVASARQRGLHGLRAAREDGVVQRGDDAAHGVGAAGGQRARRGVGLVVELAHRGHHHFARAGAHHLGLAEHARNRGGGHAGHPGHVLDCDALIHGPAACHNSRFLSRRL